LSFKKDSCGLLKEYIKRDFSAYLLVSVVVLIGLIFGATYAATMGIDGIEISYFLEAGFKSLKSGDIPNQITIAQNSFKNNFITAFFIWFSGITVILSPLILIALFVKGMSIGFTVSFLVKDLGISGGATAVVSVLPHNVLLIPMFIVLGAVSTGFCINFIKSNILKSKSIKSSKPAFIRAVLIMTVSVFIIAIASFIQAFISPALLILASRFI